MQVKNWLLIALPTLLTIAVADRAAAQTTPTSSAPVRRTAGQLVPGQKRPPGDPAQIARGKTLYGVSCTSCHGADLRGGDLGGPNLLRSQVALSDQDGELIVPIIQGAATERRHARHPHEPRGRDSRGRVYSQRRSKPSERRASRPPSGNRRPASWLAMPAAGQAYFAAKCGSCHSATGDLAGIATRITDPKALQTTWVAGGRSRRCLARGRCRKLSAHRHRHRHRCRPEKRWRAAGSHRRFPGHGGAGRRNLAHLPPGRRCSESRSARSHADPSRSAGRCTPTKTCTT